MVGLTASVYSASFWDQKSRALMESALSLLIDQSISKDLRKVQGLGKLASAYCAINFCYLLHVWICLFASYHMTSRNSVPFIIIDQMILAFLFAKAIHALL
jgi:hypothetical protein